MNMYNFNFAENAQEILFSLNIMQLTNQIETLDIVGRVVTIIDFDLVEIDNGIFIAIIRFKEFPDGYYCAGRILTHICESWAHHFSNYIEAAEELNKSGGVEIRVHSPYKIEILDTYIPVN